MIVLSNSFSDISEPRPSVILQFACSFPWKSQIHFQGSHMRISTSFWLHFWGKRFHFGGNRIHFQETNLSTIPDRSPVISPLFVLQCLSRRLFDKNVTGLIFQHQWNIENIYHSPLWLTVGFLLLRYSDLFTVESLSLFYLLFISWFICFRRLCIDKLGVFPANQTSMCLDPHLY